MQAEYREILERIPHITRAEVQDDGLGGYRVQVVSHSSQSPRHVVREIVSVLRMSGLRDIKADNVVVLQVHEDDERPASLGRLKIAGFAVTYGPTGHEAECRLTYGSHSYEGQAVAPSSGLSIARATLVAVNQAFGQQNGLQLLEATQMTVSGVPLSLALVTDAEGEVMAGNAVHRDTTAEETMIRAVLDAVNRRFVLYMGQKV